jgi:hypothetical protein
MSAMSSVEARERIARLRDLGLVLFGTGLGALCAYGLLVLVRGFEAALWEWLFTAAVLGGMIATAIANGSWGIRVVTVAAITTVVACLAYVIGNPLRPSDRAAAIAGSRPYCIQVAQGALGITGYRPAASKLDLTGLTMRAAGFQFHAVMAVGEGGGFDLYNWSYRRRDWMPLRIRADAQPVISCRPRTGFVQSLPPLTLVPAGFDDTTPVYLGKRGFVVPARYKPQYSSNATVTFVARAPDFTPVSDCTELRQCLFDWVTVYLQPGSRTVWLRRNERTRLQDGSVESGVATHIECPSGDLNAWCSHIFMSDGVLFWFRHRQSELPQWREMQARLLDLYRSFEVRDGS